MLLPYQIIASDLDGTLLNSRAEISEENIEAIHTLTQRGVHFVPASGRSLSEMPQQIVDSEDIRYIIFSNGATVIDRQTGRRILLCISNEVVKTLLDIVLSYDVHLTVRHNGRCFVDAHAQTEEDYRYYRTWDCHENVIKQYGVFVEDFIPFIYSLDNVETMSIFFHDDAELAECRARLTETNEVQVVAACDYNLELFSMTAGKGNALYCLADELSVDHDATISVGDSDNDATITQAAGLGLAVSNACASLKAVADEVICSNEEHAIAYVLKQYF